METKLEIKKFNKLAIFSFAWLLVVITYFFVLLIPIILCTSFDSCWKPLYYDYISLIDILRLLVMSLPFNTVLGLVSLYQIRHKEQRGKALAKWSAWSIGIMILLYIISSFIFQFGDPAI